MAQAFDSRAEWQDQRSEAERPADFSEPTKRELREKIAEAMRNTARLPIKGKGKT